MNLIGNFMIVANVRNSSHQNLRFLREQRARLEGLEPPTRCLGGSRANDLKNLR